MAKSSSLKRKDDKFLLKVMLVFAGIFAVLITALLIYNATKVNYNYADFDQVDDFGQMTSQQEDKYLLYYYAESCFYCQQIKDEVLAFATDNQADAKMYLMDAGNMTGTNPFPEGGIGRSTPTLHVVVNGTIVESVEGTVDIMDVLDQIEAGSHPDYSSN